MDLCDNCYTPVSPSDPERSSLVLNLKVGQQYHSAPGVNKLNFCSFECLHQWVTKEANLRAAGGSNAQTDSLS